MIRLNCFFTLADEEKKKAFVPLAQELVEKSRTDAGCIAYDILFSCTNPLAGMICETWQDQASLDLHAHAVHFTRLVPQIKALTVEGMKRDDFLFRFPFHQHEGIRETIIFPTP